MSSDISKLLGSMTPVPVQRPVVPTQAQIDEVEKVRGMQARTEAMKLAVEYAATRPTDTDGLVTVAQAIADFITGPLATLTG